MTNRKHHCRKCGGTFCQQCSAKTIPLPQLGINEHVRVCDGCYIKLKLDKASITASSSTPIPKSSTSATLVQPNTISSSTTTTRNANNDDFDDDMKKAIELSLKEAEQQKTGYGNGYVAAPVKQAEPVKANETLDDDPDLAAAIAASLRDIEISSKQSSSSSSSGYQPSQQQAAAVNKNELSSVEMENILLFSTLMDRVYAQGGDISNDQQINQLYTQIGTLQPKLVKNLDEIIRKRNTFIEIHEKLNMAVRAYDRLLEERISNVRLSNNIPEQQYQHQPLYHQQQMYPLAPTTDSYYSQQQQGTNNYYQTSATPVTHQDYSAPPHQEYSAPPQDAYYPPPPSSVGNEQQQQQQTYYPPQSQQFNNQDMSHYYSAPPAQHYQQQGLPLQQEPKKPVEEAPLIDL
jgi:growth factor-regulated tyrosine kinase substrate